MKTKIKYQELILNEEEKNREIEYKEKYNIHPLLAKHLAYKNINNIEEYLKPTIEKLDDPYKIPDMDKAVELILNKVNMEPDKILIVGDYDVDGITASSVLYLFFKENYNVKLSVYIPERVEGYGLKKEIIDYAEKNNKDFIITVDNGIAAFDAIDYAKDKGMTVIVTDHHAIQGKLPNADYVLNAIRKDSDYKDKYISGVGMAFNVIRAINSNISIDKYMPILAIGTVADVVPLLNENRIFVYEGIKRKVYNKGLLKLMKMLGIKETKMTSEDIGFKIGPLINSAGREGYAQKSFQLFIEEDDEKLDNLVKELEELNIKRKKEQKDIENSVEEQMKKINTDYSIVITPPKGKNYNPAIVGIVASRIKDKYNAPTIILAHETKDNIEYYKGSARGTDFFDFTILIQKLKEKGILVSGGGHKAAAGLTILKKDLNKLIEVFEEVSKSLYSPIKINYLTHIELPSEKRETNKILSDLLKIFSQLEPIGEKNRFPYISYDVGKINDLKFLGKDKKHFSFRTESGIKVNAFYKTENNEIPDVKNKNIIAEIKNNNFENENGEIIYYKELHLKYLYNKIE